jgi:hypothetical protein
MTDHSDFSHVRWIAGGTGAGKSTLTRLLVDRYRLAVYDGDAAESNYIQRSDERRPPYLAALLQMSARARSTRTAEEVFESMPSRHGETFPFVLDDLRAMAEGGTVLADDFRTRPADVAPLLRWPEQAVFLLPTDEFRRQVLTRRYADPDRARANWGTGDHRQALEVRLARDHYWDQEIRAEAVEFGLPVVDIDGSASPDEIADDLAARFRLS